MEGAKPKDIAAQFGLTASQVSDKAKREKWKPKKTEISQKIETLVEDDLTELCRATVRVHKEFMRRLEGQMGFIENPYLFDGERTNSLFQTAMNNAVKVMLAVMKQKEGQADDEEAAGFNVFPDA